RLQRRDHALERASPIFSSTLEELLLSRLELVDQRCVLRLLGHLDSLGELIAGLHERLFILAHEVAGRGRDHLRDRAHLAFKFLTSLLKLLFLLARATDQAADEADDSAADNANNAGHARE